MMIDDLLNDITQKAETHVKENMERFKSMTDSEKNSAVCEMRKKVMERYDKNLEDVPTMDRMAAAMAIKTMMRNMPLAIAWLVDQFFLSMAAYIEDNNRNSFCERMEKLVDYIVDYRLEIGGKEADERNKP